MRKPNEFQHSSHDDETSDGHVVGDDRDTKDIVDDSRSDDDDDDSDQPSTKSKYLALVPLTADTALEPVLFFPYPSFLQMERKCPIGYKIERVTWHDKRFRITYNETRRFMYNAIRHVFKAANVQKTTQKGARWNIFWGEHFKPDQFQTLLPFQRVNHFPGSFELGRKDRLYTNILRLQRKRPQDFELIPETFVTSNEFDRTQFLQALQSDPKAVWILKPPNMSCGRGIKIITGNALSSVAINKLLTKKKAYVAQRYIANPLLIDGLKFDIRFYVVVTSYDPLRIYLFDNGLVRFCTHKYSSSTSKASLQNRFSHLTNYSVNKKNLAFEKNEQDQQDGIGSKWSYQALLQHLANTSTSTSTSTDTNTTTERLELLQKRIQDLIIKTFICVESRLLMKIACQRQKCGFELYGFDVLLDDTLRPWLLEVNVFPSMSSSSPMDKRIKTTLLSDCFQLVGIPVSDVKNERKTLAKEKTNRLIGISSKPKLIRRATFIPKQKTIEHLLNGDLTELDENDLLLLKQVEQENLRNGHFQRIFPSATSLEYMELFESQRYNNVLCSAWLHQSANSRPRRVITKSLSSSSMEIGKNSSFSAVNGASKRLPQRRQIGVNRLESGDQQKTVAVIDHVDNQIHS